VSKRGEASTETGRENAAKGFTFAETESLRAELERRRLPSSIRRYV
jgi:hypothetical protein